MIRRIQNNDLDDLYHLEQICFKQGWTYNDMKMELQSPYAIGFIAGEEKITGFILLLCIYENAEIADICVNPEEQGKGTGNELMQAAITECIQRRCENITLEVRKSNTPAISLYKKYGFEKAAVRRSYYADGEDAWLMRKVLKYDTNTGNRNKL